MHPGRTNTDAVARDHRLCPLDQVVPVPLSVPDPHLVIRQPLDGEILAELPVGQIVPAEPFLPVAIRFDLIDEDRALLPPVAAEIGLPVAFDVEPLDAATALYGLLPDGGAHDSSAPLDLARQPDVDREQPGHLCSVRD